MMEQMLWKGPAPLARGEDREDKPYMEAFPIESENPKAAVIVLPGGGYRRRADHEGTPVANWLNSIGIAAFVLHYRVSPNQHPAPLLDVQRAIRIIRHEADKWNVDPERIGVLGFSAGGHLASSAVTLFDQEFGEKQDVIDEENPRPDLGILCYPVISFLEHAHEGSKAHLLGENPPDSQIGLLSTETQVTADTPPCFLWHTADDASVPVENSLMFAASLSKNRVPFALHVYESGRHGLGLAEELPDVAEWTETCGNWLKKQGFC